MTLHIEQRNLVSAILIRLRDLVLTIHMEWGNLVLTTSIHMEFGNSVLTLNVEWRGLVLTINLEQMNLLLTNCTSYIIEESMFDCPSGTRHRVLAFPF